MQIEKIDKGFLDTNFRFAQVLLENRFVIGLRVAKRIEKTDLISASFMMLCLISIVIYGNADGENRQWFSRYEPHFVRFYSKISSVRSSSSEAYREDQFNISIIYDALFV
jgi:hypothetical protein